MPVILEPETFDTWLDCHDEDERAAAALMKPADEDVLEFFEIGAGLNKVANDSPELQRPTGPLVPAGPAPARQERPNPPSPQGDLFG